MIKKYFLVILLLFSVVLTSCDTEDKIMKNYPQITDENHVFEEVNIDTIIQKLENEETFYLVMGFPTCPWCQALMPVLNEVAKEYEGTKIYYLDILDLRDNEESLGHEKYLELENNYFKEALDIEKDRLNAPTFVKVKNGSLKQYHLNTVSTHTMNENGVLPALTDAEKNELIGILRGFFD